MHKIIENYEPKIKKDFNYKNTLDASRETPNGSFKFDDEIYKNKDSSFNQPNALLGCAIADNIEKNVCDELYTPNIIQKGKKRITEIQQKSKTITSNINRVY